MDYGSALKLNPWRATALHSFLQPWSNTPDPDNQLSESLDTSKYVWMELVGIKLSSVVTLQELSLRPLDYGLIVWLEAMV